MRKSTFIITTLFLALFMALLLQCPTVNTQAREDEIVRDGLYAK